MAFALGSHAQSAGYQLNAFDSIGSTNAHGLMRAKAGETGPLWLVTGHQTGGRGRRNRAWISPRGNLAASILEVIDVAPAVAATLGFAAGVALADALRGLGVAAELKWPNDVLLHGAKLAGILLEAETVRRGKLAVVTGIGVNVVSAPKDVPYAAISLADTGLAVSAVTLFEALSDRWADARQLWDEGRGMLQLRERWLACAAGVGAPVTIQTGGRTVTGVFETLDHEGHLIVATPDGERLSIASGEVFFGDAATGPAGAA